MARASQQPDCGAVRPSPGNRAPRRARHYVGDLRGAEVLDATQRSGANRAVKCRSWRGWDTMRMPGRPAARRATRRTTSIT